MYDDNQVQDLLNACKNKDKIFCYGAGHYGSVIYAFLEMHQIKVESFIVTKGVEGTSKKVISWDKICTDDLKGSLVILSLHERLHDKIKKMIFDKCSTAKTYAVTADLFENLPKHAHDMALVERICRIATCKEKCIKYKQRTEMFFSRYEKVVLRYINSDRIGSLALNWLYYCSEERPDNEFWLFFTGPSQRVVNSFLDKKIKESNIDGIRVISDNNIGFWQYVLSNYKERILVDASLPNTGYFEKINRQVSIMDKRKKFQFLEYTRGEIDKGECFLEEFHLENFIIIFARDSNYTQKAISAVNSQDVVFDEYRNLPIVNFLLTAKYLEDRAITSVRVGSMPADDAPLPIFDYGRKFHDDFLDVFLSSRCRYFVGTPSGVQHIADLFGKLMVMVNVPVLSTERNFSFVGGRENLMILQKYWDTKNKKYLTIRDMLRYEFYRQSEYAPNGPRKTIWLYHEDGIVPVKNTPEEILAVVIEMEERIEGNAYYDETDILLQSKYDEILKDFADEDHFLFNYRMGREFLRQNQWLLD